MHEDMTVRELVALLDAVPPKVAAMPTGEPVGDPFKIVVLDRGFVYVGRTVIGEQWVRILDARNIRVWGTSNGLGELALHGPIAGKTVLDSVGVVTAPLRAVIHLVDTEGRLWKES